MFCRLPKITPDTLSARLEEGRILEADRSAKDGFPTKVLLGRDGYVYKFFRIRRFLSSNLLNPYALRFTRNSRRLRQRGIVAPDVRESYWIPLTRRQVVIYPLIAGSTLRDCLARAKGPEEKQKHLFDLGHFLAGLHHLGILFHAGHLNNYLRLEDSDSFGLIDVTDVYFFRSPLKRSARIQNLRKLSKGKLNRAVLDKLGWASLLEGYHASPTLAAVHGTSITEEEISTAGDGTPTSGL